MTVSEERRRLRIKASDYEAITVHAKKNLPHEACGLIAGRVDGEVEEDKKVKIVEKVYFMTNIDASGEHFSIDPREHLSAVKDMRANSLLPLGNFHSHPETPARPSEEDIRLAYDSSASYLILSLAEEEPVLKAFHIEDRIVSPEEIEIE
jgi:proteasome lid subunit RPN8/RPN11